MNAPRAGFFYSIVIGAVVLCASSPAALRAQTNRKNPASKIYVSDVAGDAQIDTGTQIEDVNKRSVYNADGAVIDTKRPDNPDDKHYSSLVFSNGTGAFLDADTRVEVRTFVQEPFVPTRSDVETEPSISRMQVFVARGTVGLCPSKLVAGSTMGYSTPFGSVKISGGKAVIQSSEGVTKISMLDGESTVRAGDMDMGGHTLHTGEQAIIQPSAPGQPNSIQIVKIPPAETARLDNEVSMACVAKRTVYFEVRGRQPTGNAEIQAFNGDSGTQTRKAGDPIPTSEGEIVAVPIVPSQLPVQFTISPAALTTPSGQGGPPGG